MQGRLEIKAPSPWAWIAFYATKSLLLFQRHDNKEVVTRSSPPSHFSWHTTSSKLCLLSAVKWPWTKPTTDGSGLMLCSGSRNIFQYHSVTLILKLLVSTNWSHNLPQSRWQLKSARCKRPHSSSAVCPGVTLEGKGTVKISHWTHSVNSWGSVEDSQKRCLLESILTSLFYCKMDLWKEKWSDGIYALKSVANLALW